MAYEFKASDVYDFARSIGADTRERGDELNFKKCPYCGESEGQFSVNLENGTFKCFRASCDKHGHFVQLAKDFGYKLDFGEVKQSYRPLPQPKKKIETTNDASFYLETRKIDWRVAERYGVTTKNGNSSILVFPFFDEDGVLQTIKYRNMDFVKGKTQGAKEWTEKGTKPILFGMKQCEGFDRLIITEGQLDSLSVATCGFDNVVSVPMGCVNFAWYANCCEWLSKFKEIIVFGDWEYKHGDKMTLLDDLRKRLPTSVVVKAVQKEFYLGEKDANDILTKYGKEAIIEAVNSAKVPPVLQIKRLVDAKNVDISELPKIRTNIRELDRLLQGGIRFGELTILSGKRGEGKSTLMSQLIAEATDQEINTFVYSGELPDYYFKRWLDLQIAGPDNVVSRKNEYNDDVYSIPDDVLDKINRWYSDRIYLFDNNFVATSDATELKSLQEIIVQAITYYNCRFICIDNLMTAMSVDMSADLYRAQSDFVKALARMAKTYEVAIILVAHPKKTKEAFQNDDVAGSADITNLGDLVMNYSRNHSSDYDCDGLLSVTKNRLTGRLTKQGEPIELYYSASSKRIMCAGQKPRRYGWETQALVDSDFPVLEDDGLLPAGW